MNYKPSQPTKIESMLNDRISSIQQCVVYNTLLSLNPWRIITWKTTYSPYARVVLLQNHLKTLVQCVSMQWRIVHISCSLKIVTATYLTSLGLKDDPCWMKNFLEKLMYLIHTSKHQRSASCSTVHYSSEFGEIAKREFGFLMSFQLTTEHKYSTVCSCLLTRNDISFMHCYKWWKMGFACQQ